MTETLWLLKFGTWCLCHSTRALALGEPLGCTEEELQKD